MKNEKDEQEDDILDALEGNNANDLIVQRIFCKNDNILSAYEVLMYWFDVFLILVIYYFFLKENRKLKKLVIKCCPFCKKECDNIKICVYQNCHGVHGTNNDYLLSNVNEWVAEDPACLKVKIHQGWEKGSCIDYKWT